MSPVTVFFLGLRRISFSIPIPFGDAISVEVINVISLIFNLFISPRIIREST